MYRTFNCGIGMVLITAPEDADRALRQLEAAGEPAYRIGTVLPDPRGKVDIR
jgi:phosphoribosylformylglycinamidine cyclo-ligase